MANVLLDFLTWFLPYECLDARLGLPSLHTQQIRFAISAYPADSVCLLCIPSRLGLPSLHTQHTRFAISAYPADYVCHLCIPSRLGLPSLQTQQTRFAISAYPADSPIQDAERKAMQIVLSLVLSRSGIHYLQHASHYLTIYTSLELRNLTAGTNYLVRVQAICEGSLIGPSSRPIRVNFGVAAGQQAGQRLLAGERADWRIPLVVVASLTCTCLIFLISVLIYWRKCFQTAHFYVDDNDSPRVVPTSTLPFLPFSEEVEAIPVKQFPKHVAEMHATGSRFTEEFEEIQRCTTDFGTNTCRPKNKRKNHYVSIVAYDHTQVRLCTQQGKESKHGGFINANYIDGYNRPQAYIVSQGPQRSTAGEFWRMIWEQHIEVIVMLTQLVENGQKKADQYWPSEGSEECGGILVTLKSTRITFNYTIRQFVLQNARLKKGKKGSQKARPVERMITQFHYTKWPKSVGCESALALLSFIRRSGASRTEATGPILVHCSATAGWAGTYIVLDSMLHQMREQGTVNVLGFLKHVRTQRKYLVQTEEQYMFIHDVLVHAVVCGDTEASAENLHAYVDSLLIPDSTGFTALERQFKILGQGRVSDADYSSAHRPCNRSKNRSLAHLPAEQWRVCLSTRSGVEGSDYINASFIPGYRQDHEYIVTQRPAPHTMGGFWRMVWERKAQLIVSLAEDMPLMEEEYVYWPIRDKALNCGNFCVKLLKEDCVQLAGAERLAVFNLLMFGRQSERPLELKLIKCPRWPNPDGPISGAFELITIMNDEKMTSERPIIVHDQLGGVSAAAFCSLASLWAQLEEENIMDVFQVARGIQKARPGSFTDLEHYQFLYKALLSLVVSRETRNGLSLAERNGVAILPEDGSVAESLQSLV
uniref:receptor-type tyrosine-protein phosphatase gamma-like n=1 Tax=Myxine glutinosa TaxID=7769 RepID=UPI00358F74D3